MGNLRVRVVIEGRVQGVFFRDSMRQEASALGVTGWVRNRRDGAVEALVEGPEDKVRQMIEWCRHGPPAASVRRVNETKKAWKGEYDSFDVIF